MTSNPSSTAIHTLNEDVLLHIFEFNGDMFEVYDALGTTRATSQVCRKWRYLMLETPSLWAKLVDIGEFSELRNSKWQKEVIRRSGDAPLWIMADNTQDEDNWSDDGIPCDDYIDRFFEDIVTNNWHRIEKLVLPHNFEFNVTHLMLSFPAPLLVHIEAAAGYTQDPQNNATTTPLFANHAPLLREIYLSCDFVSPRAPWLHQLCSLNLDNTYSFSDALAVLSATVNLQELKIWGIGRQKKDTSLPIVSLSRLEGLTHCFNDPNAGVTLLDHMSIPIGCSLTLYFKMLSSYARYAYNKPLILSIIDHFFRHAEPTLKSQTFDCLQLEYTENKQIYWKCTANVAFKPLLLISVPLQGHSDTSILELFWMKLLQLDLSSPTYLKITIDGQPVSHLGSFLSCLPSVETIYTNLQTLLNLTDIQNSVNGNATDTPSSILPMLKVIKLYSYSWKAPEISIITEITSAFLLSRFQAGTPITTLDLSQIQRLDTRLDFQPLGEAKCLTVLYKLLGSEEVIEYKCGSRV